MKERHHHGENKHDKTETTKKLSSINAVERHTTITTTDSNNVDTLTFSLTALKISANCINRLYPSIGEDEI
jgi:hypothetical protein